MYSRKHSFLLLWRLVKFKAVIYLPSWFLSEFFLNLFQATARWWNTDGMGNASVLLHPLLTRLALSKHNAYFSVPLWSWICNSSCSLTLWNWLQSALCRSLPSLHPSHVQILHLHWRCLCKATSKVICSNIIPGEYLLACWQVVLQGDIWLVL